VGTLPEQPLLRVVARRHHHRVVRTAQRPLARQEALRDIPVLFVFQTAKENAL
jgi:hypothetical protein